MSLKSKTVIVGAGLSGLMLAQRLNQKLSQTHDVTVYDKARGVGGRMATRRTDHAKFDHGAQFYRLKDPLADMHARWLAQDLVSHWFDDAKGVQHFSAKGGMTALAKDLAADLNVVLDERVHDVAALGDTWTVKFESGLSVEADHLVFTCPVPQSLEILGRSGHGFPSALSDITYTKALVVLIEDSPVPFVFEGPGYLEPAHSPIFSVADQKEKGVSASNALTVTLGAQASNELFDSSDDDVLGFALDEIRKLSPSFRPGVRQVKKWRYCQVQKSFGELYCKVAEGLYLAGDGFGGASLNGAARSASALGDLLLG